MKIVFVIDSWNDGNGGVVATKRLVQELIDRGHTITIVSTGAHTGNYEFFQIPGFGLPGMRESLESMGFLFGKANEKVLRRAFEGADLVQVQFPFFMSRRTVRIAKKMGVPVIGACHVQPQNVISAMGKESALMEMMFHFLFNFCLFKQVDAIHCPSAFAADLITRHGSRAHCRVISNGIPREYKPQQLERPSWFGDRFVVMNIGRHALEKRQELLIAGVLKSKYRDNIQLLLCGKGENSEKLRMCGTALPVRPLITYVSQEEKLLYLNTADLYLHSSVVELESLSCLEAIGCGLPCLIGNSPYSAAPQFALDDRFIFEMDDADSLARKIDYWYEHRHELGTLRQSVLMMAEKYRMDRCVAAMEQFHADAAEGRINRSEVVITNEQAPQELLAGDLAVEERVPEFAGGALRK
ncbi:MAG: glycosyltransferase [Spirochaetes bacterium]|nr:glycosyltransferase [Spirochaetota bacterium]